MITQETVKSEMIKNGFSVKYGVDKVAFKKVQALIFHKEYPALIEKHLTNTMLSKELLNLCVKLAQM